MKTIFLIVVFSITSTQVFAEELGAVSQSSKHVIAIPNMVQLSVEEYIVRENEDIGSLIVHDSEVNKDRKIHFVKYLGEIGMSGKDILASAQFKDLETNDTLDIVFYLKIEKDNVPKIVETVIYKVNNQERLRFDQHGKRWPIIQNKIVDRKMTPELEKLEMKVVIKDENVTKK